MADVTFDDDDPILPVKIAHNCEQIFQGKTLVERYNYLVYEFETEEHAYWARAYMDNAQSVSVFGPFAKGDASRTQIEGPPIDTRVLSYLRRRFSELSKLGPSGYEPLE